MIHPGMGAADWSRGRILGRGSTATVFLASSPSCDTPFAVKSAELDRSDFLHHEQMVYSSVGTSDHIVSYLGFDVSHDHYDLFLEYAPGGSLADEIKKSGGGLDEPEIRSRTRDILAGLAHLHSNMIAHCDVKPQNVLIGCSGGDGSRAKIADLGCARFVDGVGRKGHFSGTPMFMAPEVARAEEQGLPADIWAVGCTVIEMATGRAPWPDANDAVSLIHRIAFSGDVPVMPEWLSDEGKDFLEKCLTREAGERWTADELLLHPFVSNCSPDLDSGCRWTSPKSTLHRSFWDSLSESEEEEEERDAFEQNGPNAIDELFSHGNHPNWTWDEHWATVRADDQSGAPETALGGGESRTPADGSKDEIVCVGDNRSATSASISEEEESEFIFNNNHPVTRELQQDSDNYSDVTRAVVICSDNFEYMTILWQSNWIFPFVSGSHFAFVLPFFVVSSILCFNSCWFKPSENYLIDAVHWAKVTGQWE